MTSWVYLNSEILFLINFYFFYTLGQIIKFNIGIFLIRHSALSAKVVVLLKR